MKKILIALILLFAIIGLSTSVNAATITETTNPNDSYDTIESGTIVIGVTKFTPDTIVTGVKAAIAGANDIAVYMTEHGDREGYAYPDMYYYLAGDWYQFDTEGKLTHIDAIDSLDIYYVNNEPKEGITFPVKPEEPVSYSVHFTSETEDYETQVILEGNTAVRLEDPTKEGYTFAGWYLDGELFDFSTTIVSDTVLVAKWEPEEVTPSYTVTFMNGSSVYQTATVEEGEFVTEPTEDPTKEGYTFVGWYKDGVAFDFTTEITSNTTLTAEWKAEEVTPSYTVTFMNGSSVYQTVTVEEGKLVTEPTEELTKEGYTFIGWYQEGAAFDFTTEITSNLVLVAEWKLTTAVVYNQNELETAIANQEITTIKIGKDFEVDKSIVISRELIIDGQDKKIAKSGTPSYVSNGDNYIFKLYSATPGTEVTIKNIKLSNNMGAIIVGNNTVAVVDNVDLTGNVWGGIEVSGQASLVATNLTMTDETYAKPVIWVNTQPIDDPTITFEGSERIHYQENGKDEYHYYTKFNTVTFDSNGGSDVTSQKVVYGQVATEPTAPTKENYTLVGWYKDGVAFDFATKITSDTILTAQWKLTTVIVNNQTELETALANQDYTTIKIGKDFEVNKSVVISRGVTIDGQENKITKSGTPIYVSNGDNYIFKIYPGAAGTKVTIQNIDLTNSMGAIIVGPNTEAVVNNVDLTGNVWGGIEVSGKASLVATNLTMTDEIYAKPVIWVNTKPIDDPTITFEGSDRIHYQENEKDEYHYYTKFNTVTFNTDGGSEVASQKVVYGQAATEPTAPTKQHYEFKHWYLTDDTQAFDFTTEILANTTLNAAYTLANYTISFDGLTQTMTGPYNTTATITIDDPAEYTANGYSYIFDGWSDGKGNVYQKGDKVTFTENVTYTKTWKVQKEATSLADLQTILATEDTTVDEIVVSASIAIDAGDSIALDFSQTEKPVIIEQTITNNGTLAIKLGEQTVITEKTIVNNGELTLEGTTGTIATSEDAGNSVHAIRNTKSATLTINGGTYDATTHASATVYNAGGNVIIEDGTFLRSNENGSNATNNGGNSYYLIDNYGTMTINGGNFEFDGEYSSLIHNGYQNYASQYTQNKLGIANPTMTINGGTFAGGLNTLKNDDGGIMIINGGKFVSYAQQALLNWNVATINGGTFDGTNGDTCIYNSWGDDSIDKGQLNITGGEFIAPNRGYAIYQAGANASLTISNTTSEPVFKDYDGSTLAENRISNKAFTDERK